MNENAGLVAIIVGIAAIVATTFAVVSMHSDYSIRRMVEAGASPESAACAVREASSLACVVAAKQGARQEEERRE